MHCDLPQLCTVRVCENVYQLKKDLRCSAKVVAKLTKLATNNQAATSKGEGRN